jgi:TatD DNase family protein
MIDTHAHLFLHNFNDDLEQVIQRANEAGVEKIFNPNVDVTTIDSLKKLCNTYSDICFPLMGLHPESVKENFEKDLEIIENELNTNKYYGVGEIGIDLYWDKTFIEFQIKAFKQQILMAKKLKLPIIIHTREAYKEVFDVVDKEIDNDLKGIFHCFSGTLEDAQHILEYKNFKIGIGGIITYKKTDLPLIIEKIDLQHIVLETDSPFLAPVPRRGQRNESSFLTFINEKISEIKHESLQTVIQQTTYNTNEIFAF